jgi:hypothetical protein
MLIRKSGESVVTGCRLDKRGRSPLKEGILHFVSAAGLAVVHPAPFVGTRIYISASEVAIVCEVDSPLHLMLGILPLLRNSSLWRVA